MKLNIDVFVTLQRYIKTKKDLFNGTRLIMNWLNQHCSTVHILRAAFSVFDHIIFEIKMSIKKWISVDVDPKAVFNTPLLFYHNQQVTKLFISFYLHQFAHFCFFHEQFYVAEFWGQDSKTIKMLLRLKRTCDNEYLVGNRVYQEFLFLQIIA